MVIRISAGGYTYTDTLTKSTTSGSAGVSGSSRSVQQMVASDDSTASIASFQNQLESQIRKVSQTASSNGSSSTVSDNFNIDVPSSLKGIFEKASEKYGVSEKLLEAIAWHESRFQTDVTSSSGAMGVMQLMPVTAKSLGVRNAYDPEENIMAGAELVSDKLKEFGGNLDLAMAAYSDGSGAVHRAGNKVPSSRQAQEYVRYIRSVFPNGV